jgi:hypothetical protein
MEMVARHHCRRHRRGLALLLQGAVQTLLPNGAPVQIIIFTPARLLVSNDDERATLVT